MSEQLVAPVEAAGVSAEKPSDGKRRMATPRATPIAQDWVIVLERS